MAGILGIDAAWTEKEPSGLALLESFPEGWRCVAVAPSYDSFLGLARGMPLDWSIKAKSSVPDPGSLIGAAEGLLEGQEVAVIAVDMPLSTDSITGRRAADSAISKTFGGKGCATHSPNSDRPGRLGERLRKGFAVAGFPLATDTTPVGTSNRLVEVYPHPALLSLTGENYRLPYKVSKSRRYWPGTSLEDRKTKLLSEFEKILAALRAEIYDIPVELSEPADVVSVSGLKRYEDSLDALVCAWVGAKYLAGEAVPYGDHTAAVWVP